ncbi:hypothetical protein [Paracoccus alkanivorans]|nr:hypothetical protein [Paracoccus alkanivorans]
MTRHGTDLASFLPGLLHAFLVLSATLLGAIWFMSPVGLGFASWPDQEISREKAHLIFSISYFIGLPALVIGQLLSIVVIFKARPKIALAISAGTFGGFLSLMFLFFCSMP